tara:strand:+ start:2404 stop:2619 length:216 start_codon:yes stop_codon:yes gene_type:complete
MTVRRFRVHVDLGSDGTIDLMSEGNINNALRKASEECRKRRVNPISVNVQQIIESDDWETNAPVRNTNAIE